MKILLYFLHFLIFSCQFEQKQKKIEVFLPKYPYLEGGPEASFYLQTPDTVIHGIGSYESNFYEYDDNQEFRGIANVIGIKKK